MQAEVEETLKRIQTHKGVIGTIVVNAEGEKKTRLIVSGQYESRYTLHILIANINYIKAT